MRSTSLLFSLSIASILLVACGGQGSGSDAAFQEVWQASVNIDSTGVVNIAEGDTIHSESGLTMYETTGPLAYSPDKQTELFAWEIYAQKLRPVKLIIGRFIEDREYFELVGESELVIPEKIGPNRFVLREPIPIGPGFVYGLLQPEEPAVPFKKIRNWKSMLTVKKFKRPLMRRDWFSVYGWRYSMKVFSRDMQY